MQEKMQWFEDHYLRISGVAAIVALQYFKDPERVDEIVSKTTYGVYKGLDKLVTDPFPAPYICTIAGRKSIDLLRQLRIRPDINNPQDMYFAKQIGVNLEDRTELEQTTRMALGNLFQTPQVDPFTKLLIIENAEGCTHSELAAKYKIAMGTVKTKIRRGKQRMREYLKQVRPDLVPEYAA